MDWDEIPDGDPFEEPEGPGPQDDPAVRELEPKLIALFESDPTRVYYETQLGILFERDYFHWVTARALKDLRLNNRVGSELLPLQPKTQIRFYFHHQNRYWKRKAAAIRNLVLQFSDQEFTNALGLQGELLVDAGFPRFGFLPASQNVKTWADRTWQETAHDLDRVFSRDGVHYGTEIKNRLSYIPPQEFHTKLRLCEFLGLKPLFIARMMPKTYIDEVVRAGGFCLIMKYQFYPASHKSLAAQVREELRLPVDSPARLQDTTIQRFLTWHTRHLKQPA